MATLTTVTPIAGLATEPTAATHDPFEPDWARSLENAVLRRMNEVWFRARVINAERIPSEGPAILASNHSGDAFP